MMITVCTRDINHKSPSICVRVLLRFCSNLDGCMLWSLMLFFGFVVVIVINQCPFMHRKVSTDARLWFALCPAAAEKITRHTEKLSSRRQKSMANIVMMSTTKKGYLSMVAMVFATSIFFSWSKLCHSFSFPVASLPSRRRRAAVAIVTTTVDSPREAALSLIVCRSSNYFRSGGGDDNRSTHPPFQDWADDPRINVRNLLTQRAIQSFMFLCDSLRDPHSGRWIEQFLGFENQLSFHGTGASYTTEREPFGGTWDGPLLEMMERPKDVVIVSAKRSGKGHKGWSKDNPYMEDRYVEFHIDIDPVSLANRILAVREQVAREWATDLDIVAEANDRILDSYFKLAKDERRKKDDELLTTPGAFERTAVNLLNNHTGFSASASSPLRKGNFDLLYNLCTQASVHRLLGQFRGAGGAKEESYSWLRDFYTERVADYFDGDQSYGRADDFIEDLLLCPPSVIHKEGGRVALADPFGLAEQIIETRNEIVVEWKEAMNNVPADHQDGIRRLLLEKQMAAWGSGFSPLGGGSTGPDGGSNFQ